MNRAVTIRRTTFGLLAAGATCAMLSLPAAGADPQEPADPATPTAAASPAAATPASPAAAAPASPAAAAPATPATDDCNAAGLATTISSVTANLNTYFAAHPDVNQALIDAARQPSFVAVGQFDDYFEAHPEQADDLRGIQAPLTAYKDRCGLQVAPTDALAVLAEV
jgi:hemophore-related protein